MESFKFLQDLTVVLSSAAAVLLLFKRFKQPPVLGYLAAGLLLGPLTPTINLISDPRSLDALAHIGVVFLLFALGVEFNLRRLYAVGIRALLGAGVEIVILMGVGYAVGLLLGLEPIGALLLGGVISLASTAIVARLVLEQGRKAAGWGELASGILIAEDIFAVILIAFFASAGTIGSLGIGMLVEQLARFAMLVTLIVMSGLLFLPWIMGFVERSGLKEVRTLVIIGTCFGLSFLTELLGFSAALGAFLAGAMMSETAAATKLRDTVEPFKDVFGAVFFVAVGMLVDPTWIISQWRLALGLTVFVAAARFFANFIAVAVAGEEKSSIIPAALARMPVGEFSFILAQLGDRHGLTQWPLYPFAVLLCLGTTALSAWTLPVAVETPARMERFFPSWLDRLLSEYRSGIRRVSVPRRMQLVLDLIQPSLIQIFLNLLGISGLFLGANWVERHGDYYPGVLWMAACFVSMPFLYAMWRKAQAVTLILLEEITTRGSDPRPPMETHPAATRGILGIATVLVAWWYLSLSWTLLPPWPYTPVPLIVMLVAGAFLWRRMNKFYASIQVALRATLARSAAEPETSSTVISHLVDAQSSAKVHILSHTIGEDAAAAGMAIREMALRSLSGASILQINRGGEPNTSPGPQTHLQAGDEVLLIGEREQIARAKSLLEDGPASLD